MLLITIWKILLITIGNTDYNNIGNTAYNDIGDTDYCDIAYTLSHNTTVSNYLRYISNYTRSDAVHFDQFTILYFHYYYNGVRRGTVVERWTTSQ